MSKQQRKSDAKYLREIAHTEQQRAEVDYYVEFGEYPPYAAFGRFFDESAWLETIRAALDKGKTIERSTIRELSGEAMIGEGGYTASQVEAARGESGESRTAG